MQVNVWGDKGRIRVEQTVLILSSPMFMRKGPTVIGSTISDPVLMKLLGGVITRSGYEAPDWIDCVMVKAKAHGFKIISTTVSEGFFFATMEHTSKTNDDLIN